MYHIELPKIFSDIVLGYAKAIKDKKFTDDFRPELNFAITQLNLLILTDAQWESILTTYYPSVPQNKSHFIAQNFISIFAEEARKMGWNIVEFLLVRHKQGDPKLFSPDLKEDINKQNLTDVALRLNDQAYLDRLYENILEKSTKSIYFRQLVYWLVTCNQDISKLRDHIQNSKIYEPDIEVYLIPKHNVFILACMRGLTEHLNLLLDTFQLKSDLKEVLCHYANLNLEILRILAAHKIPLNTTGTINSSRPSPLVTALKEKNQQAFDFILTNGGDPNAGNPLYAAVEIGDVDNTIKLLKQGAKPNSEHNKNSVMYCAYLKNDETMIAALENYGLDINPDEYSGILDLAADKGKDKVTNLLAKRHALNGDSNKIDEMQTYTNKVVSAMLHGNYRLVSIWLDFIPTELKPQTRTRFIQILIERVSDKDDHRKQSEFDQLLKLTRRLEFNVVDPVPRTIGNYSLAILKLLTIPGFYCKNTDKLPSDSITAHGLADTVRCSLQLNQTIDKLIDPSKGSSFWQSPEPLTVDHLIRNLANAQKIAPAFFETWMQNFLWPKECTSKECISKAKISLLEEAYVSVTSDQTLKNTLNTMKAKFILVDQKGSSYEPPNLS